MKTIVIILAGGKGGRFCDKLPKQFIKINGIPLLIYTIKKFNDYPIILTIPKEYYKLTNEILTKYNINNISVITGGETRQKSVYNALNYIAHIFQCDNVIITDACRPCIKKTTIKKCLFKLKDCDGVVTVCKSVNTSCLSVDKLKIDNILDRTNQYDLLMPQCFHYNELFSAHNKTNITNATDDAQIGLQCTFKIGMVPISLCEGIKMTTPEDLKIVTWLLREEI